jgi:hypothetical protein
MVLSMSGRVERFPWSGQGKTGWLDAISGLRRQTTLNYIIKNRSGRRKPVF